MQISQLLKPNESASIVPAEQWSDQEDTTLLSTAEKLTCNWKKISAKYFNNLRTETECSRRYHYIVNRLPAKRPGADS